MTGFEPATSSSRTKRSTKLSHIPRKTPPYSQAQVGLLPPGERPRPWEASLRLMRYLIVGCGRVGSALAKLLDADGHEVIVVDENASAFKRLGSKLQRSRCRRYRYRLRRPQARRRGDRRRLHRRYQRRQSQHHGGPHRPAHVQDQAHRRSNLRPASRANVSRTRRRRPFVRRPSAPRSFATCSWKRPGMHCSRSISVSSLRFRRSFRRRTPANASAISRRPGASASRRCDAARPASSSRPNDFVLEVGDEVNAIVAPEAMSEFAQRFHGATPHVEVGGISVHPHRRRRKGRLVS